MPKFYSGSAYYNYDSTEDYWWTGHTIYMVPTSNGN